MKSFVREIFQELAIGTSFAKEWIKNFLAKYSFFKVDISC